MKKLIYFWCDSLRGFKDTEFNFSSKYKVHFDEDTKTLTVAKDSKNYVDNFFGKAIELNAIIGNNGVGKSSLLKELFHTAYSIETHIVKHDNVLVFEDGRDWWIYNTFGRDIYLTKIENQPDDIKLPNSPTMSKYSYAVDDNPKVPFYYIAEVLDQEMYNSDVKNYSTGGRIEHAASTPDNRDIVVSFFHNQFSKCIDFVSSDSFKSWTEINKKNKRDNMSFLPQGVKVFPGKEISEVFLWIRNAFDDDREVYTLYYNIFFSLLSYLFDKEVNSSSIIFKSRNNSMFENPLLEPLLCSLIFELKAFYSSGDAKKDCENILNVMNKYTNCQNDDIYERFKYVFEGLEKEFEGFGVQKYKEFLEKLNGFEVINDVCVFIPLENVKDFNDTYKEIAKNELFLNFDWGFSSGETAMLDLYSKFYQIYKSTVEYNNENPNSKYTDIILLIDEADAYFHPQWQKDYVKDTLNVAKQIFEGFGVQIILATHSPIMLSDIPKQNVLYLKKEENDGTKVVSREKRQETFGANIFSLFKDTFFLEGSGIGSFAEENLEELLKRIHDLKEINEEEIEYIKKRIMMIGDPFIRQKFENEFCICIEKKDSQRSLDEKIRFFEKEIESLKKQKERDKNDKD